MTDLKKYDIIIIDAFSLLEKVNPGLLDSKNKIISKKVFIQNSLNELEKIENYTKNKFIIYVLFEKFQETIDKLSDKNVINSIFLFIEFIKNKSSNYRLVYAEDKSFFINSIDLNQETLLVSPLFTYSVYLKDGFTWYNFVKSYTLSEFTQEFKFFPKKEYIDFFYLLKDLKQDYPNLNTDIFFKMTSDFTEQNVKLYLSQFIKNKSNINYNLSLIFNNLSDDKNVNKNVIVKNCNLEIFTFRILSKSIGVKVPVKFLDKENIFVL